ncbi:MAG: hypothetical protein RIC16_00935 [Rhodospirillales bacterium]
MSETLTAGAQTGTDPEALRQRFENEGEASVRAAIARGGKQAFDGDPATRKAATEWLAERERQRIAARGTPLRLSIVGPVICAILVVAGFALVASF